MSEGQKLLNDLMNDLRKRTPAEREAFVAEERARLLNSGPEGFKIMQQLRQAHDIMFNS